MPRSWYPSTTSAHEREVFLRLPSEAPGVRPEYRFDALNKVRPFRGLDRNPKLS